MAGDRSRSTWFVARDFQPGPPLAAVLVADESVLLCGQFSTRPLLVDAVEEAAARVVAKRREMRARGELGNGANEAAFQSDQFLTSWCCSPVICSAGLGRSPCPAPQPGGGTQAAATAASRGRRPAGTRLAANPTPAGPPLALDADGRHRRQRPAGPVGDLTTALPGRPETVG